jgi:hypothetical protein
MKGVAKKYMRGFFVTSNVSVKNIKKNTEVVHVHRNVTRGPQIVGRPAPRLKKPAGKPVDCNSSSGAFRFVVA